MRASVRPAALIGRLRPPAVLLLGILVLGLNAATPVLALDYLNVTVEQDRAVPGACLSFTGDLPRGKADALEPFIAIEPKIDHSLQARGKDLCIGGLKHGAHYAIRIRAGLPGADGTVLGKDVPVDLAVPDRDRQVSFDQSKSLLPFTKGVGPAAEEHQRREGACHALSLRRSRARRPDGERLVRPARQRLQSRHDRGPQHEAVRGLARHRIGPEQRDHDDDPARPADQDAAARPLSRPGVSRRRHARSGCRARHAMVQRLRHRPDDGEDRGGPSRQRAVAAERQAARRRRAAPDCPEQRGSRQL